MSGERFYGMGGLAPRWLGPAGVNCAALAMVPLTPRRLQVAAKSRPAPRRLMGTSARPSDCLKAEAALRELGVNDRQNRNQRQQERGWFRDGR